MSAPVLDRNEQLNVAMAKRAEAEIDNLDLKLIDAAGPFIAALAYRARTMQRLEPRNCAEEFQIHRRARFAAVFDAKIKRDPAVMVQREMVLHLILEE